MSFNDSGTEKPSQPDVGPATTATAAASPQEPLHQFAVYDGTSGGIGKIAVVNAILGLFTLGIYRFWGKTNMRRYLWSRVTLLGDRMEYTGTPMELFLGFVVAAVVMAGLSIFLIGLQILVGGDEVLNGVLTAAYLLVIYFLIFFAVYRARRYRLLRTQWRGIRFSQTGRARDYAFRAIGLLLLSGLTLGLTVPYMNTRLQAYRTNNTWFGNRQLSFDGRAAELFWKWLLALVIAAPTLGISLLWYSVTEFRYFASRTRFGNLSFASTLKTSRVFVIYLLFFLAFFFLYFVLIGGVIGVVIGAGETGVFSQHPDNPLAHMAPTTVLGMVVVALVIVSLMNVLQFVLFLHPLIRAVSETLLVKGTVNLDEIQQSDAQKKGRGEGLADVLDVGAI